jgi:hypothetical protein
MGLALATTALGCGGGMQAKFAAVKAGEMPADEAWPGVYFSAVYGNLHLVEQEGNIVGRWKRKDGSQWGELSGTAQGNLLNFKWTEHKYGVVGPAADVHGTGYFVYGLNDDKLGKLSGQYAIDDSDGAPGDWNCLKQKGMKPDLDSINGQSTDAAPASSDHWQ